MPNDELLRGVWGHWFNETLLLLDNLQDFLEKEASDKPIHDQNNPSLSKDGDFITSFAYIQQCIEKCDPKEIPPEYAEQLHEIKTQLKMLEIKLDAKMKLDNIFDFRDK